MAMLLLRTAVSLACSFFAILIGAAFVRVWRDGPEAIRDRRLAKAAAEAARHD